MAHIKTGGTTKGNRDSKSKRLGVKLFGGQKVMIGNIIVRQKGTKFHAGDNTRLGRDHTIFAIKEGTVDFIIRQGKKYVRVI